MSELVPQPWEIWHARFDFSEGHGYKYRPVIVLATSSFLFISIATFPLALRGKPRCRLG